MFFSIINKIKINLNYKKKFFITKINKSEMLLVKQLIKLNLIKNIIKINNNFYKITLNYINSNSIFKKIKFLLKSSKPTYINYTNLKKITLKNNLILVLTTSKGILNNFEALNKKIGGSIVIKIWN